MTPRRGVMRLALALALAALAWLGWSAFGPAGAATTPVRAVTLWTQGATGAAGDGKVHVALAEARGAPVDVPHVPDAAYLRRAYPQLRDVHIRGAGVDEAEAAALRGLRITWDTAAGEPRGPAVSALEFPREIALGQRLVVRGAVTGVQGPLALTLENPDGRTERVELAGREPRTPFEIAGSPAVAAGLFRWMLRLGEGEVVELGVKVVAPVPPRVLLLQEDPTTELARLQRWLAAAGARVLARTRVSAGHHRWAAANGAVAGFAALTEEVLAGFDVILATEAVLAALTAPEAKALLDAVRGEGLGIVWLDAPHAGLARGPLTPWSVPLPPPESEARWSRLRLADGTALDEPVACLPVELPVGSRARVWARDPQERVLVAELAVGEGRVARSLITDTWRWLQRGRDEDYALFWSRLLATVARPDRGAAWKLSHAGGPIFAGEPLEWADGRGASHRDWVGMAGWNTPRLPDGASAAFHVQPTDALPALRSERRQVATARLVAFADDVPDSVAPPAEETWRRLADGLAFALFVAGAGALWWRERRGIANP